jgi:hypothetical protein
MEESKMDLDHLKTTLSGTISGLVIILLSAAGVIINHNTQELITAITTGVVGIGIALVGYFSADHDKVIKKLQEGENVLEKVTEVAKAVEEVKK